MKNLDKLSKKEMRSMLKNINNELDVFHSDMSPGEASSYTVERIGMEFFRAGFNVPTTSNFGLRITVSEPKTEGVPESAEIILRVSKETKNNIKDIEVSITLEEAHLMVKEIESMIKEANNGTFL